MFRPSFCTMTLNSAKEELFTPDLSLGSNGAEVLGTAIGSTRFLAKFLAAAVSKWATGFHPLRSLPLQCRQLLFRFCLHPQLTHLSKTLRSDDPTIMVEWSRADNHADAELRAYLSFPCPAPHLSPKAREPSACCAELSFHYLALWNLEHQQPVPQTSPVLSRPIRSPTRSAAPADHVAASAPCCASRCR